MVVQLLNVSFEHHPDGFGIESPAPRLSWRFSQDQSAPTKGWHQTAYEVEILRRSQSQAESFRVESNSSVLNPWPSRPLASRERASVKVRAFGVSNVDGRPTEPAATDWSAWHAVEAGLLQRSDWTADFITTLIPQPKDKPHRPLLFRKTLNLEPGPGGVERGARLYITSLGVYEAHINGRRVGDLQMTPGWTSYGHRLQYQVYDVSELLQEGENVLAAEVAEGWYAGRLCWGEGFRNFYGDTLGLLAQLEIQQDGQVIQTVVSDGSWRARESALITSEIYDGEVYDAREEEPGWSSPGFRAGPAWNLAQILPFPQTTLFLPDAPPVRVTQVLTPREITTSASGKTLIDFGQNLVGKIHIQSLTKPAGHVLTIRHAEILQDAELCTRPLRTAAATDTITFSATPLTNWSPRFTFHGFRYVELTGWTIADAASNITAHVMHSDLPRTGHFRCSSTPINTLHANAVWSFRGNSLALPTDCPQRDERLGWTGDIAVFAPSACYLYRCTAFLASWLRDLAADQAAAGGIVPMVVPDVLRDRTAWPVAQQAVWDDVAVLLPWEMWRWSGDAGVLGAQWGSMVAHVDEAVRRGKDGLWDERLWQLGDWLDPNAPPGEPGAGRTDGGMVADAYLVHVTEVMARVAGVLGKWEEAARYGMDFERLKGVFRDKYVAPSGLVVGDSQTSLALAIVFDLYDGSDRSEVQREAAGNRLARLVKQAKYRVSTGFAGTPLVLHALSRTGHVQEAYRMLLEEGCPSWLYPVSMGATTVWERWDSLLPDGSVNPGEMTSFNHYALGSVVDWLHGVVAGLTPIFPGWERFRVMPLPGGTLKWAEARFEGPYGLVVVKWLLEEEGTKFRLGLQVPPNTEALVVMPGEAEEEGMWVGSGVHRMVTAYEAPGEWPPKGIWT